jgi:hypothetical protein
MAYSINLHRIGKLKLLAVALAASVIGFQTLGAGVATAACPQLPAEKGKSSFTMSVPKDGNYRFWIRMYAPDATSNSLLLRIDDAVCDVVVGDSASIPVGLSWVDYKNGNTGDKLDFDLKAGAHTITLSAREPSVGIDTIVLAADKSCVPKDDGKSCGGSNQVGPSNGGSGTVDAGGASPPTATRTTVDRSNPYVVIGVSVLAIGVLTFLMRRNPRLRTAFGQLRDKLLRRKPLPHNLENYDPGAASKIEGPKPKFVKGKVLNRKSGIAYAVIFAVIGTVAMTVSFAATLDATYNLSGATPCGDARLVDVSGSVDGKILQFGPIYAAAVNSFVTSAYASNPGWEELNNRPVATSLPCRAITFNYGHSDGTNFNKAGPGEIGGTMTSSLRYRSWYAKPIERATFKSALSASGKIIVTKRDSGDINIGWFNTNNTTNNRPSNSIFMRLHDPPILDDDDGDEEAIDQPPSNFSYGLYAMATSQNYLSNGTKVSETVRYLINRTYSWTMTYSPDGGVHRKGKLTLVVTDLTTGAKTGGSVDVEPEVHDDGAIFNRFGLFATNSAGGGTINAYLDDIVINNEPSIKFESSPNWDGHQNRSSFTAANQLDCKVPQRPNFGFSQTSIAGGQSGEIGGLLHGPSKSWYAAKTENLTLKDNFYATGKLRLLHDSLDTDFFFGWFNNQRTVHTYSKMRRDGTGLITKTEAVSNLLMGQIGGPTHWGFRFSPIVRNNTPDDPTNPEKGSQRRRNGSFNSSIPLLNMNGNSRTFWICYVPDIDGKGNGQITTGLLADKAAGIPQDMVSKVSIPSTFKDSTVLNRFGILAANYGGKVAEIYVDDLRFTKAPGDGGPPSRCL